MLIQQCPKCKKMYDGRSQYQYCYEDGAKLRDLPTCFQCGEIRFEPFKFCPKCGIAYKDKKD